MLTVVLLLLLLPLKAEGIFAFLFLPLLLLNSTPRPSNDDNYRSRSSRYYDRNEHHKILWSHYCTSAAAVAAVSMLYGYYFFTLTGTGALSGGHNLGPILSAKLSFLTAPVPQWQVPVSLPLFNWPLPFTHTVSASVQLFSVTCLTVAICRPQTNCSRCRWDKQLIRSVLSLGKDLQAPVNFYFITSF